MLVIRLFCNQGMSTSLLVEKMREAAKMDGEEADIAAFPIDELDIRIEGIDCALLGPQVSYRKAKSAKICEKYHVPMDVVPMADYGLCDGRKVLEFAKKLAGK